jgi:putative transcriptional regulator
MEDKNITNYVLNINTNIRFQTIQSLKDNTATRIDFKVLAKLCYSLNCSISDIIEYIPNKE